MLWLHRIPGLRTPHLSSGHYYHPQGGQRRATREGQTPHTRNLPGHGIATRAWCLDCRCGARGNGRCQIERCAIGMVAPGQQALYYCHSFMRHLCIFAVRIYQWVGNPFLRAITGGCGCCRFEPSCSAYAVEAFQLHGSMRGGWLALRRLCRCHPWGGSGFDPVPQPQRSSGTRAQFLPAKSPENVSPGQIPAMDLERTGVTIK